MTRVLVLLSSGRHPASRRQRAADLDARALAMAQALAEAREIQALHAGDSGDPALREYLGLGVPEITVLSQDPGVDVLPAMVDHVRAVAPALVLAGRTAEHSECSGTLPYALAQVLGLPLVPGITQVTWSEDGIDALMALPRGRRRRVQVSGPAVATVDAAAPSPPQWAFRRAQSGRILTIPAAAGPSEPTPIRVRPARARPARAASIASGDVDARLQALLGGGGASAELRKNLTPEAAAETIWNYLERWQFVGRPDDTA